MEERCAAVTAASIVGIGMPSSSALWLVQRPVPFLLRLVQDQVDQRLAGVGIDLGQDGRR